MTTLVLATLAAALQGGLLLAVCWPRRRGWRADWPLLFPLAVLLGLGSTSAIFFAASLLPFPVAKVAGGAEALLDLVLAAAVWSRCAARGSVSVARPPNCGPGALLTLLFVPALLACGVAAERAFALEPHGGWDGWAIWNLHARLLYRAAETWPTLLGAVPLAWTHLDYPLLLPAAVARLWAYAGHESTAAGGAISFVFGFCVVGVLVGAVALLRNWLVALIAGLALLGTPFFVTFSGNQHADIPLAAYLLATLAIAAVAAETQQSRGLWALAGALAGLAAGTKNEGLLFCAVVAVLGGIRLARLQAWRELAALGGGLAVALLPVAFFKLALAPANDLVSGSLGLRVAALFDLERHRLIFRALTENLFAFGEWGVAPLAPMGLAVVGAGFTAAVRRAWLLLAVVGAMMVGYHAVYLLTPWPLAWHLETSLVRLMLQLWPAIIFVWALVLRLPEPPPWLASFWSRGWPRPGLAVVVAVNVVAVVALTAFFARQKAPAELAVAKSADVAVSVTAGRGWYEREAAGRRTWQWSEGDSTLRLHVANGRRSVPVQLGFELRAIDARAVIIRVGERELWRGQATERWQRIELPAIEALEGVTEIQCVTEAPARAESAAPDARRLAFALSDVHVRILEGP